MATPSSEDRLLVQRLEIDGTHCGLTLADGEEEARFLVELEEVQGLRVFHSEALFRWLMTRGKLWAQPRIADLLDLAFAGSVPGIPHLLENGRNER